MAARSGNPARKIGVALLAAGLMATLAIPAHAAKPAAGFLTDDAPMITIDPGLPAGASVKAIISSGDELGDFMFEGLPDGIGIRPGAAKHTVDVYVAHEQTTVAFFGSRDFQDASVSRLTMSTKGGPGQGAVLDADVALGPEEGFLRFCSASMGTPEQGLDDYVFFTGEEANDPFPLGEHGVAVVLNTRTGENTAVPGMGRLNHENTMLIPGGWDEGLVMLTTDDTFSGPSAQLYMYVADDQDAIFDDEGSLFALRINGVDGAPVNATNAFNGANDYLDLGVGESFQGEFIPVPDAVADDTQPVLEEWSNDNNIFQAIRLEDLAFDKNDPRVVYIADTGRTRVIPDTTTGRMTRGPGGTVGQADNGRIFKMVMNADDPMVVDSLTILADGDLEGTDVYVPMVNPDNMDTSKKSLMIQEDTDDAKIWQHRFDQNSWRVAATVNDPDGESSGIVDASEWFGGGTWLVDVQGHGMNIDEDLLLDPPNLVKRESGQVMLMKIPAS
jgi:hypothetical protein